MSDTTESTALPAPTSPVQENSPGQESAPQSPSLADTIREFREARTAKAAVSKEAEALKGKLAEAEKRIAELTGNRADPIEDTESWATALGYTAEERAFLGENLLYGLAPHRAPADWRVTVMERREARREKLAQSRAEKQAAEAAEAEARSTLEQYAQALHNKVLETKPDTFPDSDAWFGDDVDGQRARAASLMATADNMAEAARQRGEVADLTYEKVAAELEKYLSERFSRRKVKPTTASQGSTPPVQQQAPRGPFGKPAETPIPQGLSGGGSPRQPATSEDERRKRAEALLPDFSAH